MSWSNSEQQDLEALIVRIGFDHKRGLEYLRNHKNYTANQCEIDLLAMRASQLGMSYGRFVALNDLTFIHPWSMPQKKANAV